ncbi:MAG: hypothetical protein M9894_35565 [Planctomycetes bacterium]|nr:hypothetical protein [Planctomycetota bacterium]
MSKRSLTAALLLGALALAAQRPSGAQQADREVQALRREVEDLRQEKNRLQDENIALARRFDLERKRALEERDGLLRRIAALEAGGDAGAPLDRLRMTLSFDDTPVPDALRFVQDVTNVPVDGEGLEGLTVSLRLRDLSPRVALSLIAANARDAEGRWGDLRWREVDGRVEVSRPPR